MVIPVPEITPAALRERLDGDEPPVLLDVREDEEWALARIEVARHVPMGSIPARLAELDPAAATVVMCHHGGRSLRVAMFLQQHGFQQVLNLQGGIDGWSREVDTGLPRY